MRMQLMVEALAQAIEQAGSVDAVAVAHALEKAERQLARASAASDARRAITSSSSRWWWA